MAEFDPTQLPWESAYELLTGAVAPRPIAWVATRSPEGVDNLAPFSFFMAVCAKPLTLAFAPMLRGKDGSKKDTLRNLERHPDFVVHPVPEAMVEAMNRCAAELPPDRSEFDEAGLLRAPAQRVQASRIAEAPIALEGRVRHLLPVGEGPGGGCLVVGEILHVHVQDGLLEGTRIRTEAWAPVSRLAGPDYLRSTDRFSLHRPR